MHPHARRIGGLITAIAVATVIALSVQADDDDDEKQYAQRSQSVAAMISPSRCTSPWKLS